MANKCEIVRIQVAAKTEDMITAAWKEFGGSIGTHEEKGQKKWKG